MISNLFDWFIDLSIDIDLLDWFSAAITFVENVRGSAKMSETILKFLRF